MFSIALMTPQCKTRACDRNGQDKLIQPQTLTALQSHRAGAHKITTSPIRFCVQKFSLCLLHSDRDITVSSIKHIYLSLMYTPHPAPQTCCALSFWVQYKQTVIIKTITIITAHCKLCRGPKILPCGGVSVDQAAVP